MSKPAPGDYYIVNNRKSSKGTQLAITYDKDSTSDYKLIYVAAPVLTEAQVWTISDFEGGDTQTISPKLAPQYQVGFGSADHTLMTQPANNYVWTIRGADNLYTIEDGGVTVVWGLNYFIPGESVTYGSVQQPGVTAQQWLFQKLTPSQ